MDKDQQEQKKFLEEQVEWCKKQDSILEQIETKLHEMKKLAEYARDNELTLLEMDELNSQLNHLKSGVDSLKKRLRSDTH